MRMKAGVALATLLLALHSTLPARGDDSLPEETTTSSTSSDDTSSKKAEAPEGNHPDCMKSCLADDEFEFDCASYCIFTV